MVIPNFDHYVHPSQPNGRLVIALTHTASLIWP